MDETMRAALMTLADQINTAMNSEDEIDRTYLLEAVEKDIRSLSVGYPANQVQHLIDNPVS